MENLKSWAVCVVVSSVVAAVVELLVPEGGGGKPVKFITSVFVLFAFVSPFAEFQPLSFEYVQGMDEFINEYELGKRVEEQAKESLEAQVVSMLKAYAQSIGIVCKGIEADVVINADKDIFLGGITVQLDTVDKTAIQKIIDYSQENFNIIPEFKE